MTQLWIDIETIPGGEKPTLEEMLQLVPGQYKKKESIDEWANDPKNIDAVYRKRALSWFECEVICIGYAFDSQPAQYLTRASSGEPWRLLWDFAQEIEENIPNPAQRIGLSIIGHNIKGFDLPILALRAAKHNITTLSTLIPRDRNSGRVIDTMELASFTAYRQYTSLADLCKFFEIPVKEGMDGSQVYDYFLEGRIDEIGEYCVSDVEAVRKLHKYLVM